MIATIRRLAALAAALPALAAPPAAAHPVHETIGEMRVYRERNTLQCSIRVDPADLELAIEQRTGGDVDLGSDDLDADIERYVLENFIVVNRESPSVKPVMEWVGVELEDDFAWLHFAVRVKALRPAHELTNTLLFDVNPDQVNTLNFYTGPELSTLRFDATTRTRRLPKLSGGEGVTPFPRVITRGDGPVDLILIPTLGFDAEVWSGFMERNADRYTMHAVTLPGFGGSDPPPAPAQQRGHVWLDNAARALVRLVEENGLHDAAVLGHGTGGVIAMHAAIDRGELFGPIVSFDGFPMIMLPDDPRGEFHRDAIVQRKFVSYMLETHLNTLLFAQREEVGAMIDDPERRGKTLGAFTDGPPETFALYLLDQLRINLAPRMEKLVNPTLVLAAVSPALAAQGHGDEATRQLWERQVGAAPHATIRYLRDGAHFEFVNNPERFDEAVNAFLAEHATAR